MSTVAERRRRFASLSKQLAYVDDAKLRASVRGGSIVRKSVWGTSHAVDLDGEMVFVKRIPLTDREQTAMFSTRNRFRLPTYYSYGVGSAGFGAFRELAFHVRATASVLAGEAAGFPLLFHHRVMRQSSRGRGPAALPDLDGYVRYWNDSDAVRRYMTERASASAEIWLVMEYFPDTVWSWLIEHQDEAETVLTEMTSTVAFLRAGDIAHFDCHFGNVVTDGQGFYLVDFGLVMDPDFELSIAERRFLDRHVHYDEGELIWSFGSLLAILFGQLSDSKRKELARHLQIDPGAGFYELTGSLASALPTLPRELLPVHPSLAALIEREQELILHMNDFYLALTGNPRKNSRYDDDVVAALCHRAG